MSGRCALGEAVAPFFLLAAAGCSSGSGGSNPGTTSFQLDSLSLTDGAVWPVNREIVFRFREPVDFSTVSANTIQIRSASDVPAIGVFRLRDAFTVVFQPNCPTLADLSDAGLEPGGVEYVLRMPGQDTSANTVRSVDGIPLGLQQVRTFSTPASSQAPIVFQDALPGPPLPLRRDAGSAAADATHLEIGGDPDQRVYFERDANGALVLSEPGFEAPLNLYSDASTRIAVSITFDQPVSPADSNLSADRLRLEFQDQIDPDVWHALDTRVTLAANCTETGAIVRLEPIGGLPASSAVRAVVLPGFRDLVGDTVEQRHADFAVVPTRAIRFTSLSPGDVLADEMNESFEHGGESPLSLEDEDALLDTPVADWGEGRLSAAFAFEGTGGPGGNFDWVVHSSELIFFDTTRTQIIGGRDGAPTTTLTVEGGILDLRNFRIDAGGEVRVQGPNPLRIRATGEVVIRGRLDISGFPAKDVASFNSGNLKEVGGSGAGAGGTGGTGNLNNTGPTPRGGRGAGPLGLGSLGGQGGEMGISTVNNKNARRPGGGGGGRFAADWIGTTTFSELSMAAGPGSDGHPESTGAESRQNPARGGAPGEGAFFDLDPANDFFGVQPIVEGGEITGFIRGELPSLWAGYGGGAGANAGRAFPNPSWNFNSDEKGGGGGGGGGGLHIQALGRIVIGRQGQILANGARGAAGENTFYLDHIGGTGGAGSGGHVILESAAAVDFTDGAPTQATLRDIIVAGAPPRRTGPVDDVDTCRPATPLCCPSGCAIYSNGGAGGPGVIQIHVPDPRKAPGTSAPAEIIVPTAALGAANVLDQVTSPPPYVLIPTYGSRSKARSEWISIGGADERPDGSAALVRFLFEGIDEVTGEILTDGPTVAAREPLVSVPDLAASTTVRMLPDGFAVELVGAALGAIRAGTTSDVSNDVYLRTPALLRDCAVRLFIQGNADNFEDFPVAAATYAEGAEAAGDEVLHVTIGGGRALTEFNPRGADGTTAFALLPRFFQVVTNGVADSLPQTAFVKLRFQSARDNGAGAPDEGTPLQDWTSNVRLLNGGSAGLLQYFRYEVEFNLDQGNEGLSSDVKPVTLDFLKIPFVF